MHKLFPCLLLAGACGMPVPAWAQLADNNAVRQAEDGFGSSVGNEEIGIYNVGSARGFSPLDAGNVRLDGLYFDVRGDLPDGMLAGSAVKVGITAIDTSLLAPSGVAEFALKEIGEKPVTSFGLILGDYGSQSVELETRLGQRDGLSMVAAADVSIRSEYHDGSDDHGWSYALLPRLQLGSESHIKGYFGQAHFSGFEDGPYYYTNGASLPPQLPRRVRSQQNWNQNSGTSTQVGALADLGLGSGWKLKAGLFRAQIAIDPGAFEFVDEVTPQMTGVRYAILSPKFDARSWSGEAQLSRSVQSGKLRGEIAASIRFRSVREIYGAGELVALDDQAVNLPSSLQVPQPTVVHGPRDTNEVIQLQPGVATKLAWGNSLALNLGIQRADYRKGVTFGAGGRTEIASSPFLWNTGLAYRASAALTLYAGASRGLEESGIAPDVALNANTALPATITTQQDVGLHWKPSKRFGLIAGAFRIRRPYANLDARNVYRLLGDLTNRGLELSIVAEPVKGMNLVAGLMRQWPELSGEEVASGAVGKRPVAFPDYQFNGAIDYQIAAVPGLSLNANLWATGTQLARPDQSLSVPARSRLDLGIRYRFSLGGAQWVANASVGNVLNHYGWNIGGDGGFNYSSPRTFGFSLYGDF